MIESLDNALVRAAEMLKNPHQLRRVVISGKRRNYNPPLLRIDVGRLRLKGRSIFNLLVMMADKTPHEICYLKNYLSQIS